MVHDLTRLTTGPAEAGTEQHIIQSRFQKDHQVFTDHALHLRGLLIIISERLLQYAVNELGFLLLTKLQAVFTGLLIGSLGISV